MQTDETKVLISGIVQCAKRLVSAKLRYIRKGVPEAFFWLALSWSMRINCQNTIIQ